MLNIFRGKKKPEPVHTKYKPYQADLKGNNGLPKFNPESDTWLFLEGWLKNKVHKKRESNDNPHLTDLQTAVIRGEIKAYKQLLKQKFLNESGILNEQG